MALASQSKTVAAQQRAMNSAWVGSACAVVPFDALGVHADQRQQRHRTRRRVAAQRVQPQQLLEPLNDDFDLPARSVEIAALAGLERQINEAVGMILNSDPRSRANGVTEGFVKVLSDARTDRLLGAHIIGPDAGTLIAELAIAMEFGASAEDVARTSHAHPTLAEAFKEAALAVEGRAIHI